jgi:acetolactate synthase-1/2/3 large subunit
MKVADYIADFLDRHGVKVLFELSGGMITHILDALHRHGGMRVITMHHEQCSGFAAEAVGRLSPVPGVAIATSGPGATNLLTAIGSCFFDSTPTVFITGQVNRHEMKKDRAIRQLGFQEMDILTMVGPITKAAWQAKTPEEVPALLAKAWRLCQEGRPGPVLLDIPMDIQYAQIDPPATEDVTPASGPIPQPAELDALFTALRHAERPLILVGGGLRSSRSVEAFRKLSERVKTPVINSLNAVDVVPYEDPLRVGLIGAYGNRWANLAIGRADFILVLGSRLDIRQTGADTSFFKQGRTIYHVDVEPGEMNNRVVGCCAVHAALPEFFQASEALLGDAAFPDRSDWVAEIHSLREEWPDTGEATDANGMNPNELMHQISAAMREAAVYCVDVGQHQMWASQSIEVSANQRYLTSGGMGAMGFALPAAIGSALVSGGKSVVCIAGDGGFQINIQELQTIVRNKLPIKMVVVNNRCHGMSRQFQETYFNQQYGSTFWGYSAPDFAAVAAAYTIPSRTASRPDDVETALAWMAEQPGPALLEVQIDTFTNAYPKIAFGRPLTEMEPHATPVEMEGT